MTLSIAEVNAMSTADLVAAFGDVAENAPWVARHASDVRPFASRDAMVRAFADAVRAAPRASQLALLRAHPDLGTRLPLTGESSREQAAAGLGSLPADEAARLDALNRSYRSKFAFPFILAVRNATRAEILASFSERLNHSPDDEFATALGEVCRILRFRIEDRVTP
jgi:2-oxo-4-hydroxy-4-carboxy-5-ureidoimidazoline decarboxylase